MSISTSLTSTYDTWWHPITDRVVSVSCYFQVIWTRSNYEQGIVFTISDGSYFMDAIMPNSDQWRLLVSHDASLALHIIFVDKIYVDKVFVDEYAEESRVVHIESARVLWDLDQDFVIGKPVELPIFSLNAVEPTVARSIQILKYMFAGVAEDMDIIVDYGRPTYDLMFSDFEDALEAESEDYYADTSVGSVSYVRHLIRHTRQFVCNQISGESIESNSTIARHLRSILELVVSMAATSTVFINIDEPDVLALVSDETSRRLDIILEICGQF